MSLRTLCAILTLSEEALEELPEEELSEEEEPEDFAAERSFAVHRPVGLLGRFPSETLYSFLA